MHTFQCLVIIFIPNAFGDCLKIMPKIFFYNQFTYFITHSRRSLQVEWHELDLQTNLNGTAVVCPARITKLCCNVCNLGPASVHVHVRKLHKFSDRLRPVSNISPEVSFRHFSSDVSAYVWKGRERGRKRGDGGEKGRQKKQKQMRSTEIEREDYTWSCVKKFNKASSESMPHADLCN